MSQSASCAIAKVQKGSSPGVSVTVHIPDVSSILSCDLPWKVEVAQPAGVVDPLFIKVLRPVA